MTAFPRGAWERENEKGRQARRYFIDCEKALNATKSIPAPEQQSLELKLSLTRLSLLPPKEVFWVTVDEWIAAVLTDNNKSGRQLNKSIALRVEQDMKSRSHEIAGFRQLELENAMLHDKCALLEKAAHDNTKYVAVLEKYNALLEQGGVQ